MRYGSIGWRPETPVDVRCVDRARLEALRYAVNDEAESYIAIMRLFTGAISGLLSDQSTAEVAEALHELGLDLDEDTVDARLSYLVEHGNLARSPRETEARSLQAYLRNRARYQLTQRGRDRPATRRRAARAHRGRGRGQQRDARRDPGRSALAPRPAW
ncbi:DUF2397 family protein [Intrasporangium sp.]|uniref:DUF2397 family protein n=1 Tax=Intrasporangium sp. TaxID=1925024 RepID=UPI00264A2EB5|nr:DUF2397 family protein [Intrasporangium sp.]